LIFFVGFAVRKQPRKDTENTKKLKTARINTARELKKNNVNQCVK